MIRIASPIRLLTVLALLLSGLLQPLAASQGQRCARTHAPAGVAQQARGSWADSGGAAAAAHREDAADGEHHHSSDSEPVDLRVPTAPCGTAAVPAERSTFLPTIVARHLLPRGDPPPASLLVQTLFRPPRLS